MKTIFKSLALGLFLLTVASCEKHDFFDENTFTGAVGPETYWVVESSTAKAGESMGFTGQYYSTVAELDHSEVWYELFEKEDKIVSAALISAFSYSVTSNITAQKRMLQTIQSYPHSEDLWSDSLRAYVLTDKFPISNTLSPVSWIQPKDTTDFTKNLHAYFGENFAEEFKQGVTAKMNPTDEERHYAAYMQVLGKLGLLGDTILTPNGTRMPYLKWISDSTFNVNTNSWEKKFKQYDTIWSKTEFDTLGMNVEYKFTTQGRPPKQDTIWYYDTTYITKPVALDTEFVYPQIKHAIDSVWEGHVSFLDLILGADGYALEYKREYYINAELRIYDKEGTYSKTDAKEISIN